MDPRIIGLGVFFGLAALSQTACGGRANTNPATAGGGIGAAFGTGGASAGGASTGGAGASGANTGGASTGGTQANDPCNNEGATQRIGGVRFRCSVGRWVPVRPCMMASRADLCCPSFDPAKSVDVASDACLVAYPTVVDDGSDACTPPGVCSGKCAPPLVPSRMAEPNANGQCVEADECQTATDCIIAVNHLSCCSCPDAFPKQMLADEPCITGPLGTPGPECQLCTGYACQVCDSTSDAVVRCVASSGVRRCVMYRQCLAQDAAGSGGICSTRYVWNGTACVPFSSCLCKGNDCNALFTSAAACLEAYQRCGAVCIPGMDQTCNDNVAMSSIAGHCEADGTCTCGPGRTQVESSGRCL